MNKQILFSYDTLQYESVQIATFGRTLSGKKDKLVGYTLSEVEITNPHVLSVSGHSVHKILSYTGDVKQSVDGMVFEITPEELNKADQYEVSDYKRVLAKLSSGYHAWVYVKA